MTYKRHRYPAHYRSLLHFDYPYLESVAAAATSSGCGGLRDEIGLCAWEIVGGVRFVGTEPPSVVVAGAPKFGWRCPQFGGAGSYIRTGNASGIWNLNSDRNYELDMFVRPAGTAAGNILVLLGSGGELLVLSKTAENKLRLVSGAFEVDRTSESTLQQDMFSHVMLRISGGEAILFLNSVELFRQALSPNVTLDVSEVRLGGFAGELDEFRFSYAAGTTPPAVPQAPYQGKLNIATVGGYGTGSYGDANFTTAGNVQINSYAEVTAMNGSMLTIGMTAQGFYGEIAAGDEVMVHLSDKKGSTENELGFYAVRRVLNFYSGNITLDAPVENEFNAALATRDYKVQVVKIPNYTNLTVGADTVLVPLLWDGTKGGIVALKTTGNCVVSGKIITEATGPRRTDSHSLCHADIVERFILTGNIFLACGGTLTTTDNSRLGAVHPGDGKGTVGFGEDGKLGEHIQDPNKAGKGGAPGRGGGGGQIQPHDSRFDGNGGGGGGGARGKGGNGGDSTFGLQPNRREPQDGEDGRSAPNIILVCKKLSVSSRSISTGGAGGGGGGGNLAAMKYLHGPGCPGGNGGSIGGAFQDKIGFFGVLLHDSTGNILHPTQSVGEYSRNRCGGRAWRATVASPS